jgi:D-alanyl-D-alanine carboxypeptidase
MNCFSKGGALRAGILLLTLTGSMFSHSQAQGSLIHRIDSYVLQQMRQSHTPGVAIGVIYKGKVLLKKGYGLANVELASFIDTNSVFQLLSVGKMFIAAAVMQLGEKGRLSLNDPVTKYISEAPENWKGITIRHLLNHTSGIVDLTDIHPYFEQIREDATPDELLAPVYRQALLFSPGSQWQYSNSNYFLLGRVVEKISHRSLDSYLEDSVFHPLGMFNTRINSAVDIIVGRVNGYHWIDEEADKMPAFITGYHGRKNVLQNAIYISPTRIWGAGGILSTINDLIRWDAALNNHLILSDSSMEIMITPATLSNGTPVNYGLGNELFSIKNHKVSGHQGGGMAFNASFLRFPDNHLTVIVLCNQTSGPSKKMALAIAGMVVPDLNYSLPNKNIAGAPEITALFKDLLQNARNGKVNLDQFAPEAQQTAKFISGVGPEFLEKEGALRSVVLVDEQSLGPARSYIFKTVFEKDTIIWSLTLNEKKQVLDLRPQN